jgi:hypothetical protein
MIVLASSDNDIGIIKGGLATLRTAANQHHSSTKSLAFLIVDRLDVIREWDWPISGHRSSPICADLVDPSARPTSVILGFPLRSKDLYPDALVITETATKAVLSLCAKWPNRHRMSLSERAVVFNVAGRAKLSYYARLVPFSDRFCRSIDQLGRDFIDPMTSNSIPLASVVLFGDKTIGGLSNNGIGFTRDRASGLLAMRAVRWFNLSGTSPSVSDFWRRRRFSFSWQLASLQLFRITGTFPSLTSSLPLEQLFDGSGALIDPTLCSGAWALSAVHDLRFRSRSLLSPGSFLFDYALSMHAWRGAFLGGGPRVDHRDDLRSVCRTLHLFSDPAWRSSESHPLGGPLEPNAISTTGRSVIQILEKMTGSGIRQAVLWARRHSGALDCANRAMQHMWTSDDLVAVQRHFSGRLCAIVGFQPIMTQGCFSRLASSSKPVDFVILGCGMVSEITAVPRGGSDRFEISVRLRVLEQSLLPSGKSGSLGRITTSVDGFDVLLGDRPAPGRSVDRRRGGAVATIRVGLVPDDDARACSAPLCSVWRVDVDRDGDVFLLHDALSRPDLYDIGCHVANQSEQMAAIRGARHHWESDQQRPLVGAPRDRTMSMAFDSVEAVSPLSSWFLLGDLTSSMLARRSRITSHASDLDWVRPTRWKSWARFIPWVDMWDRNLAFSLDEQDFIRRLMMDHLMRFPKGFDHCPICGASVLCVGNRHLIMGCFSATLLREELVRVAVTERNLTTDSLIMDAWWWRLRPVRYVRLASAVFKKRLLAIRLVCKAQTLWRRLIWEKFGHDDADGAGFQSEEELLVFVRDVAARVIGFPA